MAFIKRFRNGKPVDPTVPEPTSLPLQAPIVPLTAPHQQIPNQNMIPIPTPPPSQPLNPHTPSRAPKRGGCGCGKK